MVTEAGDDDRGADTDGGGTDDSAARSDGSGIAGCGVKGLIDEVPVDKVVQFARELREYLKSSKPEFISKVMSEKQLSDEAEAMLKEAEAARAKAMADAKQLIEGAAAEAAQPKSKRFDPRASRATRAAVYYGYGFAPYVYYERHGFEGIPGAANAHPLPYGTADAPFGTAGFESGSTNFGF